MSGDGSRYASNPRTHSYHAPAAGSRPAILRPGGVEMRTSVVHERTKNGGARCGARPVWFVGDTRPVDCRRCLDLVTHRAHPADQNHSLCGEGGSIIGEPVTCGRCIKIEERRSKSTVRVLKVHAKGEGPWALCGYSDRIGEPVTCGVCLRAQKARPKLKVHALGDDGFTFCNAYTQKIGEPVTCKTCLRVLAGFERVPSTVEHDPESR